MVSVQAPSDAVGTVQRGLDRVPVLHAELPALILLGDANKYFQRGRGGQAGQRNSLATQK